MPCNLIAEASAWAESAFPAIDWARGATASATAFGLVAAAEFGDKSQLVCMTLAARHRHWPILFGAVAAFALLNGIAVVFGAAVGRWLPPQAVAAVVAVLFAGFGIRSLLAADPEPEEAVVEKTGHGLFATTFLMIFLAEFGDKTQLAVAGLGAAEPPLPVWLGATLALGLTSALGIWAGRALLQRIPEHAMHRLAGVLFLAFAAFAAYEAGLGQVAADLLERVSQHRDG
jgi:putative Ca2+/H+ antiporter (TMEM165/GDT1 family)